MPLNYDLSKIKSYKGILNHIAVEWDLNCRFSEIAFFGRSKDIDIAQNILINSVKYN